MDVNGTETTINPSTKIRSVFYCPLAPEYSWDLNNTTLTWILLVVKYVASPAIILLNTFIIIIACNRVLQRTSTILLTSLAVADLLVGAVNMPLSATIDVLILRQVPFEHTCFLVNVPGMYSIYFFSFSSLYHLTAIAWERHVAVVKWMDYKVIVTKTRVKKLAIVAWMGSVFTILPPLLIQVAGGDTEIVEYFFFAWIVLVTVALITIAYFYVMVYRGIRKRKISEISQVTELVKAKMESKIAKTTFLLTAAAICSFFPAIVFYILGEAFPILRTSASFRFWEILIQINSLLDPLLYCYRDRRFRNGLMELLGIRKRQAIHTTDGAGRNFKRNDPSGKVEDALELKFVAKPSRLTRTVSCDLVVVLDCVHGRSYEIMLKRSMSTPTLQECHNLRSLDDFQQPQPLSIKLTTSAIIHTKNGLQGDTEMKKNRPNPLKAVDLERHNMAKPSRTVRAASCDLAVVSHRFPEMGSHETMLKRSMSARTFKESHSPSYLDDFRHFQLQQSSSLLLKIERDQGKLPKDANLPLGKANLLRNISRSKSFHAITPLVFAKSCPDMDDTMPKRPRSAQ